MAFAQHCLVLPILPGAPKQQALQQLRHVRRAVRRGITMQPQAASSYGAYRPARPKPWVQGQDAYQPDDAWKADMEMAATEKVRSGGFKASGKTVVVTGGSQGIGRATALLFARKGYNVVVAARQPERLQYVADDCKAAAGRNGASLAVPCDITKEADVKALVNRVLAKFDSVDIVINNAGVCLQGTFEETSMEDYRNMLDINFLGAVAVTQGFLPVLQKTAKRRGAFEKPAVVMVNSYGGKIPIRAMPAYTASKYALAGFTDAIRPELESYGIHLAQVHPGMVRSNFLERAEFRGMDADDKRTAMTQLLQTAPFVQKPEEVAQAIYDAAISRRNEVTVGMPFQAAMAGFKTLGINPFSLGVLAS
ncbi:hypothetical protein WJX72_003328 [[Myrmecia] bisecta]|uniref:Uncharacterized protein n=1 Tax=[Myrmecia] bisecta TaxID=41462 RepID=A0AAW1Q3R6_9CHLO